jgi:hypothetical protein
VVAHSGLFHVREEESVHHLDEKSLVEEGLQDTIHRRRRAELDVAQPAQVGKLQEHDHHACASTHLVSR